MSSPGAVRFTRARGEDPFHANTEKNNFHCFAGSCGKRGNVLDFVAAMEKCTVRDAALKIAEWFSIGGGPEPEPEGPKHASQLAREEVGERGESATKNPPLKFQLKSVDPAHAYLRERGITAAHRGNFRCRIFFRQGFNVRARGDSDSQRERRAGRVCGPRDRREASRDTSCRPGFQKSQSCSTCTGPSRSVSRVVIVVEGFFDCMKVHQSGYPCGGADGLLDV